MDEKTINALKKFGLSEKEIKIYIANLILGGSRVTDIADKADIMRETTYAILRSLADKGLVSCVIKSGVKYFSATDPKRLLGMLQEKEKELKEAIPLLEEITSFPFKKAKVEFYEGLEGFKTAIEDLLKIPNKTVYGYVAENIIDFLPTYSLQFRRKRRENKIFMKNITSKTPAAIERQKLDKKEMRETRFVDKLMLGKNIAFYIYDEDKISMFKVTKTEQIGIIIQDKELAEFQKQIYELLWEMAKK